MDVNNYNILQKNTIATGKVQIKCNRSQRRLRKFLKEEVLKDGQDLALPGNMRKGTPD